MSNANPPSASPRRRTSLLMESLSTSPGSGNNDYIDRNSRPIPRTSSTSTQTQLSSSLTKRPPARSLVSQSYTSATDPGQYSSLGVREQTAELASLTFSTDTQSLYNIVSPSQNSRTLSGTPLISDPHSEEHGRSQLPDSSQLPEVIEEQSEPTSPVIGATEATTQEPAPAKSSPSPGQSSSSALTSMFRSSKISSYGSFLKPRTASATEKQNDKPREVVSEPNAEQTERAQETAPLLQKDDEDSLGQPILISETRTSKAASEYDDDVEAQKRHGSKQNQLKRLTGEAKIRFSNFFLVATTPKTWSRKAVWEQGIKKPISLLPCVFLGLLLNILDALSYGMILFPLGEPVFANTGPDGISMFYLSCIISQIIYSSGGSIFKGAVGSEMIEVVPFFHKMTYTIMRRAGSSDSHVLLATVTTSYALSSILTGIVFFCLGAFKLGSLVSFFPRHILIGCVGGVGFFLVITGIEVSARLDGSLEFTPEVAKKLFQPDTLVLWGIPLLLAIILSITLHIKKSPFITPAYFVSIVIIFYIVVAAVNSLNIPLLRENGWIFPAVESGVPFYHFYSYYDFAAVDWGAVGAAVPAMFALTFFGVLHVPINVPALAMTAGEDDLNLNRELVGHGISNAVSGLCGSIQNYLVYVNSAMFIENGGNTRLAGFMLAGATAGIWVAGPAMIGYVPIMVVGALIFYLGFELLEEALVDTWGKMSKLEYLTIVIIVLVMGLYDFVVGVLVGIILACLNFVVQTSRKSAIRATYSGETVESTVRRHPIQRRFLHEVGYQIYVTKLSGFLFFGSIVGVEKESRALIEEEAFKKEPIRFLIFDFFHVNGLDYSAVQAFNRIERVLRRRQVQMVISGVARDSEIGKNLRSIGLWKDDSDIGFFETLNDALEFCENVLLRALYKQRDALESTQGSLPQESLDIPKAEEALQATTKDKNLNPGLQDLSLQMASPRTDFLTRAATTALDSAPYKAHHRRYANLKQPLPLILTTFQDLTTKNEDFWFQAVPYFTRADYAEGAVVFERGEDPDAFYLLEKGILRAEYDLPVGTYHESIVAGTTCGELPFFSATLRTATVCAERDCVTWRLSKEGWEDMRVQWPEGAGEILTIAMKLTKERVDAVVGYVLTAAG